MINTKSKTYLCLILSAVCAVVSIPAIAFFSLGYVFDVPMYVCAIMEIVASTIFVVGIVFVCKAISCNIAYQEQCRREAINHFQFAIEAIKVGKSLKNTETLIGFPGTKIMSVDGKDTYKWSLGAYVPDNAPGSKGETYIQVTAQNGIVCEISTVGFNKNWLPSLDTAKRL